MDNRLFIVYSTPSDDEKHCITHESLDNWKTANPDFTVIACFHMRDEILNDELKQRTLFAQNCEKYGLSPHDFGQTFKSHDGHIMKLIRFLPRKKKYKFGILDLTEQKMLRATPGFVKEGLENRPYNL